MSYELKFFVCRHVSIWGFQNRVCPYPVLTTWAFMFFNLSCAQVGLVLVPQMCFCFVGLPFFPSASWPLSFLFFFFLFLRPCLIHARMPDWGRAFVHGHTFLHSWSGPMTFVVCLLHGATFLSNLPLVLFVSFIGPSHKFVPLNLHSLYQTSGMHRRPLNPFEGWHLV